MPDTGYPGYSRDAFQPLTLFSDWAGLSGYALPASWVDGFGMCHLAGVAVKPSGPFALPSDIGAVAAPADGLRHRFAIVAAGQLGVVEIVPGAPGAAAFLRYASGPNPAGADIQLDNIAYPT